MGYGHDKFNDGDNWSLVISWLCTQIELFDIRVFGLYESIS